MSVSLHGFTRTFMEFLSRRVRSSFPEQGVTSYSSYSTEVRYFTHERSTLCCTTGQLIPVHNSMMWGPEDDPSQSLPPSRPRMPPWCTPCPYNELQQWFVQTVRCQNYHGTRRPIC